MENQKCSWSNPWIHVTIIGMLLLFSIITVSILRERFVSTTDWQISFSGLGKIYYQPDIAKIDIGVKIDKKEKAEDALKELNEKIGKITDAIIMNGIKNENIQTLDYTLAPEYDTENKNILSGYSANQRIIVKIEDVAKNKSKINDIIKVAGQAGMNQVNGITFEPSNLEELKQEARLLAIADAKQKAKKLAKALGIKLESLVGWWENYNPQPIPYYANYVGGIGGGGADTSIASGEQEIKIEVNLSYLLDEK